MGPHCRQLSCTLDIYRLTGSKQEARKQRQAKESAEKKAIQAEKKAIAAKKKLQKAQSKARRHTQQATDTTEPNPASISHYNKVQAFDTPTSQSGREIRVPARMRS